MTGLLAAAAAAFWLGILTSVSPCPLATNLAAVTYIGRRVESPRRVLIGGLAYTFGRCLAYVGIGALAVWGLLSIPGVSNFLQRYMNKILGPLLILVGMYLLDLLSFRFATTAGTDALREKAAGAGAWGAVLLGFLFALSFCPISAALFFGSLVPLAVAERSTVLLPLLYGAGTGLPVVAVAALVAGGGGALAAVLGRVETFQRWSRWITGAAFIAVGIYLSVRFIFLA